MADVSPGASILLSSEVDDELPYEIGERLTIGRSSRNDVVIDQLDASRKHAEIRHVGGGHYVLFDLGSRNGSYVNGQRVHGSRELVDGDRVDVADAIIRFVHPDPEGSAARMEPSSLDANDDATAALTLPRQSSVDLSSPPPPPASVPCRSPTPSRPPTRGPSFGSLPDLPQADPPDLLAASARPLLRQLHDQRVVVLVSDICRYDRLLGERPGKSLQSFVADWFGDAIQAVDENRGIVDRLAGSGLLAYWVVEDAEDPTPEVNAALRSVRTMVELSTEYHDAYPDRFEEGEFTIGIGVHLGSASLESVGATQERAYTVVGDAVVVAAGLEGFAEERGHAAVVSGRVARHAAPRFTFEHLGECEIADEGRPVEALRLC